MAAVPINVCIVFLIFPSMGCPAKLNSVMGSCTARSVFALFGALRISMYVVCVCSGGVISDTNVCLFCFHRDLPKEASCGGLCVIANTSSCSSKQVSVYDLFCGIGPSFGKARFLEWTVGRVMSVLIVFVVHFISTNKHGMFGALLVVRGGGGCGG